MNAFEVLQVPATASRDEIRAAYRALARRWHPDCFMQGPERDWANEKMAAINAAYRECLNARTCASSAACTESERLARVQQLIDDGKYVTARRMLMDFTTRSAEWNYLFGAVLMQLCETKKALIYLSVAAHQSPGNLKYARAFREAQSGQSAAKRSFASLLRRHV